MATQRVQIPISFAYPSTVYASSTSASFTAESVTLMVPATGSTVTITNRDTLQPATVYAAITGASTISPVVTDSAGNVPGYVVEGSYTVTAAAAGSFSGASINWEAVRGDGVENIYAGAVNQATLGTDVTQQLVPTGTILDFAGNTAPTGFIFADGTVYAQATYPTLYGVIGTIWNTGGEGAGNFRVPDLRKRVSVGYGSAGGSGSPALPTSEGGGTSSVGSSLGSLGGNLDHYHAVPNLSVSIPSLSVPSISIPQLYMPSVGVTVSGSIGVGGYVEMAFFNYGGNFGIGWTPNGGTFYPSTLSVISSGWSYDNPFPGNPAESSNAAVYASGSATWGGSTAASYTNGGSTSATTSPTSTTATGANTDANNQLYATVNKIIKT